MEREIKFRGKRLDNGEWAVGSYLHQYYSTKHGKYVDAIVHFREGSQKRDVVDPETVGQFIDLKDKQGVDIYEGDIVRVPQFPRPLFVKWDCYGYFLFENICNEANLGGNNDEVIGNVHENPELCTK